MSLDIERIIKLGYKLQEFAVKTSQGWTLRNRHGKCVFLRKKGCNIYHYRPEGCRLYPLIYDENKKKPVFRFSVSAQMRV